MNRENREIQRGKTLYDNILFVLSSMNRTEENHSYITEYFLEEFSLYPEYLKDFIKIIEEKLEDTKNPERERLARRYNSIFSFLCERFWLYQDKHILDDLSFQILHPKEYKKLKKELGKYQKKSNYIIDTVFKTFKMLLQEAGIKAEVEGRYKHTSSVHRKCEKKNLQDVLKIWDIFAFRIIVDGEKSLCYDVLHILHEAFFPIPDRYKDYIQIPKINGYQSIHTSITGIHNDLDIAVEVQIRNKEMHEIAESWIAAHFLYGKEKNAHMLTEKEKKLISQAKSKIQKNSVEQHVYCLTPKWDIKKLPIWSTAKDFARKIHSWLLEIARYAVVNGHRQELNYPLRNFDTIEIITFKQDLLW